MNSIEQVKHLKRWIQASILIEVRKHVEQSFDLFVEGDDRRTNKVPQFMELRIDGPYIRPNGTRGEYCAFIEVNMLGNSTRNEANRYQRQNLQGLMAFILNRDFCIYKTGNVGIDAADDETLLGSMLLLPTDQIKVSDFGQIDPNTEVFQAVAEAHYEMYFTLEG